MDGHQHEEPKRDLAIPSEQAIEQKPVPFLDNELAAAMTARGSIYISLPGMCRALGLGAQSQFQRIARTPSLSTGLRVIPLETRGGVQSVNCLRVDRVALWLAGIESSRVKPQFRDKIEAYQDELAPVAMQVFMRVLGVSSTALAPTPPTPEIATQVAILAEQIDSLNAVVTFLREHMEAVLATGAEVAGFSTRLDNAISLLESLAARQDTTETQVAKIDERTQRLTPAHARTVQEFVDRMVRETKRLPTPLTYAIIYGRLKHRFRAGSYSEIADERFEDVLAYLREELRRATSGEAPEQSSLF